MNKPNDFVSTGGSEYQFKIGNYIASSLSGFIAGAVVATIIWLAAAYLSSLGR